MATSDERNQRTEPESGKGKEMPPDDRLYPPQKCANHHANCEPRQEKEHQRYSGYATRWSHGAFQRPDLEGRQPGGRIRPGPESSRASLDGELCKIRWSALSHGSARLW